MSIAPVLGVDPGHDGGACLLTPDGGRALFCASWVRRERKAGTIYVLRIDEDERELPSLHEAAWYLLGAVRRTCPTEGPRQPHHLVVEGLFARPGLALHGICSLAEATGELLGVLRDRAVSISRPKASEWRSIVLPRGWGQSSEEAEAAAHRVCSGLYPELGALLETKDNGKPAHPHALEAACLARWGVIQQRTEAARAAQQELGMGKKRRRAS